MYIVKQYFSFHGLSQETYVSGATSAPIVQPPGWSLPGGHLKAHKVWREGVGGRGLRCCGPGVTNKAPLFTRETRLLVFTWRPGDGADSWDPGTRACEAALSLKQQRPDKQNLCLSLSLASKQTFLFGPTSVFRTTASPRLPVFLSSLMRFWKA